VADAAAEAVLQDDAPVGVLCSARLRLAERRLAEALFALEEAGRHDASQTELTRLEEVYAHELATYEMLAAGKS
jgi:hypothetical protein